MVGRADTDVAGERLGAGQWMPENNYTEVYPQCV